MTVRMQWPLPVLTSKGASQVFWDSFLYLLLPPLPTISIILNFSYLSSVYLFTLCIMLLPFYLALFPASCPLLWSRISHWFSSSPLFFPRFFTTLRSQLFLSHSLFLSNTPHQFFSSPLPPRPPFPSPTPHHSPPHPPPPGTPPSTALLRLSNPPVFSPLMSRLWMFLVIGKL